MSPFTRVSASAKTILYEADLVLADKILDIAIDYALNRWRIRAQKAHPSSNRYTLRLNTYSPTFKKAKTFLLVVLAIYLTVWIIGINPVVLASAGAKEYK